jgi:hypothetical protein
MQHVQATPVNAAPVIAPHAARKPVSPATHPAVDAATAYAQNQTLDPPPPLLHDANRVLDLQIPVP